MDAFCDRLEAFADGVLTPTEAQGFAEHLGTCARCQARLTGLMQLEELGRDYLERHGPVKVPWYVGRPLRWGVTGLATATLAVLVVVLAWGSGHRSLPGEEKLWTESVRSLEARVTYPKADRYRPPSRLMSTAVERLTTARTHRLQADLEERDDVWQLAAVDLAMGTPDYEDARRILEKEEKARKTLDTPEARQRWSTADLLCDLGVADYAEGKDKYPDALKRFNDALRRKPDHVQALWNRGLVYSRLDPQLPLLAMQDFAEVKNHDPDHEWRKEAGERWEKMASAVEDREFWRKAQDAGTALTLRGADAADEALKYAAVPSMRRDFYDAVRTRTSASAVNDLLPLAQALDHKAKAGTVLADYVRQVAARDFKRRALLAQQYAKLLAGSVTPQERQAIVQQCLASSEDDIAMGAIVHSQGGTTGHISELSKRADSNPDPWFKLMAMQAEAEVAVGKGRYEDARKGLDRALQMCESAEFTYRCLDIENDLVFVLGWLFHLDEAGAHACSALKSARANKEWDKVIVLLQALGNIARMRADPIMGRAYYGEALQAIGPLQDRTGQRNIHQNLAHLAILDLDLEAARRDIDQAMNIGPLTVAGAEALVDVARSIRKKGDAEALEKALSDEWHATAGRRAYAKLLLGRFVVEQDVEKGRKLLEEAILDAGAAGPDDIKAKHARAYSYTSLIFEDAKREDFESALRRFGTELGFATPSQCVLAVTEDTERSLFVARGADGRLLKAYDAKRTERLPADMTGQISQEIVAALRPCPQVDALARPPLQGRKGLLPDDIAWRYRSRQAPPAPPPGKARYLVVNNVEYDEGRRQLDRLRWKPWREDGERLQGVNATPDRVLEAMQNATEIDLATHGQTSTVSRGSFVILAKGTGKDGSDKLREDRIRGQHLAGAPLVILAACEAGRGDPELHELSGLPYAFLAAGARGVIAATEQIPDEASSEFFRAVRDRIQGGASASKAVRDEHQRWLKEQRIKDRDWISSVLVFE